MFHLKKKSSHVYIDPAASNAVEFQLVKWQMHHQRNEMRLCAGWYPYVGLKSLAVNTIYLLGYCIISVDAALLGNCGNIFFFLWIFPWLCISKNDLSSPSFYWKLETKGREQQTKTFSCQQSWNSLRKEVLFHFLHNCDFHFYHKWYFIHLVIPALIQSVSELKLDKVQWKELEKILRLL